MTKIHIDTDLGGDMDDLCALAMVLNWPGAELVGVTTNLEDGGKRAGYTRYALDLAGRSDVPVAAGADVDLDRYRMRAGLPIEADYWPEPISPCVTPVQDALDLLEHSIDQGAVIVAIGAYTNLALLEARHRGILKRANIVLMGGYVFPPREGFPQWNHEMDWNMQIDVAATTTVLQNADPLLVPLAVTVETALRRAYLPALAQAGPLARLLARQAEAFSREYNNEATHGQTCAGLPDDIINFQHDPLACAVALGWRDGVEVRELHVTTEVVDGWVRQRIDREHGTPTRIVTAVDGPKFNQLWLDVVTSL